MEGGSSVNDGNGPFRSGVFCEFYFESVYKLTSGGDPPGIKALLDIGPLVSSERGFMKSVSERSVLVQTGPDGLQNTVC